MDILNDITEFFRPFSTFYILAMILIVSSRVHGSEEFSVYRMQQYDMPFGNPLGSRLNQISMEARTITDKAAAISRKCVIVKLKDLSLERYRLLVTQYVGAIIVLLPTTYNDEDMSTIKSLETHLLHEEVKLPVYFALESDKLNEYYDYIENEKTNKADSSAFQTLIDSVITNGFQFVINSAQSKPLVQSSSEFQAVNLQAKLNGDLFGTVNSNSNMDSKQKIPTIVLTAHYDAFGMSTGLSFGCDSNGSGVVALLEISRILSYLYANLKTIPALNVLFVLTAEGKFNYHGLKKWIEEQSETREMAGKIDLDDVLFAVSLDGIGKSNGPNEPSLYAHVSRPPKEGQASYEFLKNLDIIANKSNTQIEMVHKKINLASEFLAWEHERFSLNKIPALTVSHFKSFKDIDRTTMTDTIDSIDKKQLALNIKLIVKAIMQSAYRNEELSEQLFNDDINVSDEFIASWLDKICSVSRSASLLNKNHPLVNNFFSHFNHYLQEAVKYTVKVHPKEPEFVFYNEEQASLMIYNVKPAVFDLFLALFIAGYLGLTYLFVLNFGKFSYILNQKIVKYSTSNGNGVHANGHKTK